GIVVGANLAAGAYRAFINGGGWTNLGTLGGSARFWGGISTLNRGGGDSLPANGFNHAVFLTPRGTDGGSGDIPMKDLGTLGGNVSEASAINNSGQITGHAETLKEDHAFRYSDGTMTDIGALLSGGLPFSYGYSINDAGHVVGEAYGNNSSIPNAFY